MHHIQNKCTKDWNIMLYLRNGPLTALKQILAISLLCVSTLSLALTGDSGDSDIRKPLTTQTYVDSVYEWGLWEMGLAPAAGGSMVLPDRTINYRSSNIEFRPNDNSKFARTATPVARTKMGPTPIPVTSAPTSGPLGPGITPPTGGPGDRF